VSRGNKKWCLGNLGTALRIDIVPPGRKTRKVSFVLFKIGPLILGICVLAMFLVPTPVGPFSSVYGPATAFRAAHAAGGIFRGMATCLKGSFVIGIGASSRCIGPFESVVTFAFGQDVFPVSSVLRC
jgi:hypothetical protein